LAQFITKIHNTLVSITVTTCKTTTFSVTAVIQKVH